MGIVAATKNLFYFFQKGDQSNSDYHKEFMAILKVIEEYRCTGSLTHFPKLLTQELEGKELDLSKATTEELKEWKKIVWEKFLAALMLNGANGMKYNKLMRSMKENFVAGTSTYPESLEAVFCILNAYKPPADHRMRKAQAGCRSRDQRRSYVCSTN
jgi:hypothetical protein